MLTFSLKRDTSKRSQKKENMKIASLFEALCIHHHPFLFPQKWLLIFPHLASSVAATLKAQMPHCLKLKGCQTGKTHEEPHFSWQ